MPAPKTRELAVKFQMSHVRTNDSEQAAEFRLTDGASRLTIATIRLTPQQFYDLNAGVVTEDRASATVLTFDEFVKVGLEKHIFSRSVRKGIDPEILTSWAETLRVKYDLHAVDITPGRRTDSVSWHLWSNIMIPEALDTMRLVLRIEPLPGDAT